MKKETLELIKGMNEEIQYLQDGLSDTRARVAVLRSMIRKEEEKEAEAVRKYGYGTSPAIETEDIRRLFGWGPSKAWKVDIVPEQFKSEEEKAEPDGEEQEEDKRQKSIKEYAEKIEKAGEKKEDRVAEATRLREERNAKIIRLHEEGETIAKIAAEVECSEGTVSNVLKKWRER